MTKGPPDVLSNFRRTSPSGLFSKPKTRNFRIGLVEMGVAMTGTLCDIGTRDVLVEWGSLVHPHGSVSPLPSGPLELLQFLRLVEILEY